MVTRTQYLNDIQQQMGPGKSFMESLEAFVKGMALYLMPLAILFLFLPLFFATRFRKMRWRASMDRQLTRALSYWRIDRTELESPT